LTLDHVKPLSKGGGNSWENLVTACMSCNQRKGQHTLKQLGWKLKMNPREPSPFELGVVGVAVPQVRVLRIGELGYGL
jgi:5-methylcytosine-specific restriction endonuclease McrA